MHRLVLVVLEVADLAASAALYREAFGMDLHPGADNNASGDRWIDGAHAAVSWSGGGFLHFALYQAKSPDQTTRLAQVGFFCSDVNAAHAVAVKYGARVIHAPRQEPWGITARYEDLDGNVVSLTQSDR